MGISSLVEGTGGGTDLPAARSIRGGRSSDYHNAGAVVGFGTFGSGPHGDADFFGFLNDGVQTIKLDDQLAPGSGDWHVLGAIKINDSGHILARAMRPDHRLPFTAAYAQLFGGVAVDGGGLAFYGGRFHRVPPYDPGAAQREVIAGLMIDEIAGLLDNRAARGELKSAAAKLVLQGGAQLRKGQPRASPRRARPVRRSSPPSSRRCSG